MAKELKSLKESIAILKTLKEEDMSNEELDIKDSNETKDEDTNKEVSEEEDSGDEEILKKIELATEELDKELDAQELSDELKEAAKNLINARVMKIREELEDEYAKKQDEYEEELLDQVDEWTKSVASDWFNANRVALKESVQVKRVNAFVQGFRKLLEESQIELPSDAEEIIAKYEEEAEEAKEIANKEIAESYKLKRALKEEKKLRLVAEAISKRSMAMSKADKFRKIMEEVEFDGDEEKFEKTADKEIKAMDEEENQDLEVTADVVDDKSDLKNSELNALEEAIKRIRK